LPRATPAFAGEIALDGGLPSITAEANEVECARMSAKALTWGQKLPVRQVDAARGMGLDGLINRYK